MSHCASKLPTLSLQIKLNDTEILLYYIIAYKYKGHTSSGDYATEFKLDNSNIVLLFRTKSDLS